MRTCAHCHAPIKEPERNHARATDGTRLDRAIWLAHLEADPYCSANCARLAHGVVHPTHDAYGSCADCGTPFSHHRNTLAGPYCQHCRDRHRKKRKYHRPGVCAGCGGDLAAVSKGCAHCRGRERKRERRLDPAFVESERLRALAYKRAHRRVPAGQVAGSIEPPENGSPSGGHAPLENSERRAA